MSKAVLLDVDGTLIDSNEAHALAWCEALAAFGIEADFEDIRAKIGMGGDNLLPRVTGIEGDSDLGERISRARGDIFRRKHLPQLKSFPQARELLERLKRSGWELVVATSATAEDLKGLLHQGGLAGLVEKATTSEDAERSKPDPDIIEAALRKARLPAAKALMLGDTPYDIEAARKAGVATVAVTCGGWSRKELSGACVIYEGPWEIVERYADSPFAEMRSIRENEKI